MTFGFIITRHVRDEKTNNYWNICVQRIRKFYPYRKIIIIDDNSVRGKVKASQEYDNIEYIQSEYPGAGELLPFYYFYKHHFFDHAVILHDSVFFQKRIRFESLLRFPVLPLWHFKYNENLDLCKSITEHLNYTTLINEKLENNPVNTLGFKLDNKWFGCFGAQCFISRQFLTRIQLKYNLFSLMKIIKTRPMRCALERIIGILFHLEFRELAALHSLLGNIWNYGKWGYTYEEYTKNHIYKHLPIVKVWTGR